MNTPVVFPRSFFRSPFRPAAGLGNPHLQTVFASIHRRQPPLIERQRREVALPDGDHLLLDWHHPLHPDPAAPVVLVVHGLGGSSESHYVRGLQKALGKVGWPSVAMNCRGAAAPNHATRAYHAGASDDVISVFRHLAASGYRRIALVGYSLGGSMVLKSLAELGDDPHLLAGVAVSAPLDLATCANRMDRGLSRVYRKHLLDELDRLWQGKMAHFRLRGDHAGADRIARHFGRAPFRSFWEFDHHVMAPLHGFDGVDDYYRRCTPNQFLRDIRKPALIIHAADDPFMTPAVTPRADMLSASIHFELSAQGGHVGFIGGSVTRPVYYLEQRIPAFLRHIRAIDGG